MGLLVPMRTPNAHYVTTALDEREGREIEIQERGQPGRCAPAGQKAKFFAIQHRSAEPPTPSPTT